jgi:putative DNA-invertase from lambdoid prophage Rac
MPSALAIAAAAVHKRPMMQHSPQVFQNIAFIIWNTWYLLEQRVHVTCVCLCRVSKKELTTQNQVREIASAGFAVDPRRVVEETISGASASAQRPQFMKLLERLEESGVLLATKIDRLGRDLIDLCSTVERLQEMGVRVHCLQLGGADLTSAAGKMTMRLMATFAAFERDLLIERTHAGLERARAAGRKGGRKKLLTDAQRAEEKAAIAARTSLSTLARQYGTSRQTIMRAAAFQMRLPLPEPPRRYVVFRCSPRNIAASHAPGAATLSIRTRPRWPSTTRHLQK